MSKIHVSARMLLTAHGLVAAVLAMPALLGKFDGEDGRNQGKNQAHERKADLIVIGDFERSRILPEFLQVGNFLAGGLDAESLWLWCHREISNGDLLVDLEKS